MDIAKCKGTGCARRDACLRFTMPERAKYQNWIFMPVAVKDTLTCRFYWEVESELCRTSDT